MDTSDPIVRVRPVNLAQAAAGLAELWLPRVAARVNDVLVKVVRISGDFVWHDHPDTDEAFLCLDGRVDLEVRDPATDLISTVELRPGDLYVVSRGVRHCPHAADGATIALIEGAGVVNTGATGGDLTAAVDVPLDELS
ncbi:MAG TPA: cupin domain-containing protein [Jatrophihabitans sp.]|nr:cupin domain-containing protein [Jatrophihabitans sp.]